MNPLAEELNQIITSGNEHVFNMLSGVGKNLFFPKGILSQSAEAKEKAYKFNATIGMATEKGRTMFLPSVMSMTTGLEPEEALTYAPSFGIMPLRQTWQQEIFRKNPSLKDREISLPVVSNAITHGLSVVADMWVDPNDVILLPDKMWGNYSLIFSVRRGARIVHYPFFNAEGRFNLKGFEDCVRKEGKPGSKVIVILNFPNNPTGYTISSEEGDAIAAVLTDVAAKGVTVLAVTDDAYFGLFFDETSMKESIFTKLAGRATRLLAIKLDGATKENYVWGLRVGFITYGAVLKGEARPFYDALERKTAGAVRGSISNASHLSQEMVLKSLKSPSYASEKEEKFQIMKERALEVKSVLSDPKYAGAWEAYPFNSGYFMCLKLKTVKAEPLRVHLLNKYGVGLISLGETDLRVAFSCLEKDDTRELFDTVLQGVKDLTS
ncbi:MAG TPA: aminotransferase class I/II-fold pyridoxal phosphate-dependent enzyme [Deltaproteobacteria bacterium]|nr:aminotransferase class I/II-fold pyridoxal phosphate-dependent enzyme [Deltaproteobacteria bacterium]HIJ21233.1 aminotransferase class I/II-fold pyridoxal phosphate-dependent enzyme [Deltaproteobacteria bacterium]HIJ41840.1 aminotransferase class I/II-fold pyridoxal phosphate-dependent enzyme [Deltaproteobacteria bacterium]